MEDKSLAFKLKIIYALLAGALSCYYAFLLTYFKDRNLDYIQMGICFAALPLIGVLCQPLWGYITDKYLNKKITLIIISSCSALIAVSFVFSKTYYAILATIIFFAMFVTSMIPVLDALGLEAASKGHIHFNKTRIPASLGYSLCVLIMGIIIKYTGIDTAFYMFFILSISSVCIICTVKYKDDAKGQRINPRYVFKLFKNKHFLIFLLSALMLNIAIGSNNSYIGELIKETGGDVSNMGMLWAVVTLFEVPTLFLGNRLLDRYKDINLYSLCIFFYAVRYFLDSLCSAWYMVVLVQVMQSLTFAIYMISSMHYINRIVSPEMLTSGVTLHAAIGSGLGGFIGNIGGGIILQTLNIRWLFRVIALVCLLSFTVSRFIEKSSKADMSLSA